MMYNGLPWPDDDFIKVTIERDLVISKRFEEHPILWKVLAGLAEARPALCYCSVLLRALMAVQMNHWQASVAKRSGLVALAFPSQLKIDIYLGFSEASKHQRCAIMCVLILIILY